jgi:peptidylprolyl isomerase
MCAGGKMKPSFTIALAIAATLALGACRDNNQNSSSSSNSSNTNTSSATPPSPPAAAPPAATPPASSTSSAQTGKPYIPAGYTLTPYLSSKPVRKFTEAKQVLQDGKQYAAVMETDAGRMVIQLYQDDTPTTVNSFVFLARNRYYDGIAFHRVIDNFVVQGGDPNTISGTPATWGTGGAGYEFCLEVRQKYKFDAKGVIGMARTQDPCSNGSQFYITLGPTPNLDNQYTVFGKVIEGLDTLDKVVRGEPPTNPTRMKSVYIVEKKK